VSPPAFYQGSLDLRRMKWLSAVVFDLASSHARLPCLSHIAGSKPPPRIPFRAYELRVFPAPVTRFRAYEGLFIRYSSFTRPHPSIVLVFLGPASALCVPACPRISFFVVANLLRLSNLLSHWSSRLLILSHHPLQRHHVVLRLGGPPPSPVFTATN